MALHSPLWGIQSWMRRMNFLKMGSGVAVSNYYVDATLGNDANDGRTQATAWQTIGKVNGETFLPTDHVFLIRDGEWRETLAPPSPGIAGALITFGAYGSGATPIINGADIITGWTVDGGSYSVAVATEPSVVIYDGIVLTENDGATNTVGANEWDWNANELWANVGEDPDIGVAEASQRTHCISNTQDYIYIKDLSAVNGNVNGIRLSSTADNIIVEGCVVENCGSTGIRGEGNSIVIRGNSVDNIGDVGIYFSGVTVGEISGSTVSNCVDGIRGLSATSDVLVSRNTVYDCTDDGIDFFGAGVDNNIVEKNLVYDCADDGIKFHGGAASTIVRNNIVYQCGSAAYYFSGLNNVWYHNIADDCVVHFRMSVGDPCSVIMKNNISYDTSWRHIDHDVGVAATIDNNRYFPDDDFQYNDILYNTFAAYEAASGQDANSVMEDPLLVNAGAHNYHLLVGSPCRGAGATGTGVTEDYDGVTRGSPPDIGAYEYVA